MKLLWLLFLASVACKLATRRWPWQLMGWELVGGSARSRAEARARTLLGVDRHAHRVEIIEAHKRLIAMVHPDRGGSVDQVHEANEARDLLLAGLAEKNLGG